MSYIAAETAGYLRREEKNQRRETAAVLRGITFPLVLNYRSLI
jgi:hypothetical protein